MDTRRSLQLLLTHTGYGGNTRVLCRIRSFESVTYQQSFQADQGFKNRSSLIILTNIINHHAERADLLTARWFQLPIMVLDDFVVSWIVASTVTASKFRLWCLCSQLSTDAVASLLITVSCIWSQHYSGMGCCRVAAIMHCIHRPLAMKFLQL